MNGTAIPLQRWQADFAAAVSLAIELDFEGPQPCHFGAPRARSAPLVVGDFSGEVAQGASCNCRQITLVPHCNGTHTEGVGHLVAGPTLPLHRVVPAGPMPALLLSVTPVQVPAAARRTACGDDTDPPPRPGDRLVTSALLRAAWPRTLAVAPLALILRTLPNDEARRRRDHSGGNPPYLSRQAVQWLVERGIEHLVLDLPSLDRSDDAGRLTGHRLFFGLPPGATQATLATRPAATITEFAFIPPEVADGPCALQLQLPAFTGDAVPSRPLLLPLREA
ncbi:MAG: hypothetical protein RL026_651 [Pseudomonadota bacterium]